jgi:hypothetical protein
MISHAFTSLTTWFRNTTSTVFFEVKMEPSVPSTDIGIGEVAQYSPKIACPETEMILFRRSKRIAFPL